MGVISGCLGFLNTPMIDCCNAQLQIHKSPLGQKPTRTKAHLDKSPMGQKPTRTKAHLYAFNRYRFELLDKSLGGNFGSVVDKFLPSYESKTAMYWYRHETDTKRTQQKLSLLGGGYSHFIFICRLGPTIYRSPQKNISNFKHPK